MKNKNIKFLLILAFIILNFCTKNSYAVDLKHKATIVREDEIATATIRNITKRYGTEVREGDWYWYGQGTRGKDNTYGMYGIGFWGKEKSARYKTNDNDGGYKSAFDKTVNNDFFTAVSDEPQNDLPEIDLYRKNNGDVKYYWLKSPTEKTEADFSINLKNFTTLFEKPEYRHANGKRNLTKIRQYLNANTEVYRKRGRTISRRTYSSSVVDLTITQAGIQRILDKYYTNGDTTFVEGEFLKIRFSITAHTRWNPDTWSGGPDVFMKTAYQARKGVKNMNERNYAVNTSGTSILNYYDNWLYIPLGEVTKSRKLTIVYKVKNENGQWVDKKIEEKEFGVEAAEFQKASLGESTDAYYIGGKIAQGDTKDQAVANMSNTNKKWGWNQSKISIEAADEEQHYIVYLYYDYRKFEEKHLTLNGDIINDNLNKIYRKYTKDPMTFNAIIPLYNNYNKYAHVKTKVDDNESQVKKVTFNGVNGSSQLIMGTNHKINFYYEYEPPRKVYVRHLVYDDESREYKVLSTLTNSSAAIKDGEDGKYYLRPNGYNQRHQKCGDTDYRYISAGYNEQYTIDFSDTIKLDKSRTIENEGTKYNYKGVKIKNDSKPAQLTTKIEADTLANKNTIIELAPERVERTYVDFYYTKDNIPPPGGVPDPDPNPDPEPEPDPTDPDPPTLEFEPQDDGGTEIKLKNIGSTSPCKTVYVPSGENLKAYINASIYRPYSLIYESDTINQTTGKISYKLKKYDAYKFINGAVQNNLESQYGYINSTSKKGVFNTENDTAVKPIDSNITNELLASIRYYKEDVNPNTITTVEDGRKTTKEDFGADNVHKVNYDKYNGVRNPAGIANYNVMSLVENGVERYIEKQVALSVKTKNNTQVNVYTPAKIKELQIESVDVVNHSNQDSFVIQKNAKFKVKPIADISTKYENISDTSKYIKYYWLVLDFDAKLVQNEKVFDKDTKQIITMNTDQIVRAGNLIQIPVGATFSAIATNDSDSGDIINQFSNKLKVVAVTYNATDDIFENRISETIKAATASSYVDKNEINKVDSICGTPSNKQTHIDLNETVNLDVTKMYDDAKYFAEYTKSSKNIGRIYDFKVTDCLDVNFKNVFRVSENGNVNDLRGIKYFSGVRKLLVYGGAGVQLGANPNNTNNIFAERVDSDSSINAVVSKTVLPLGPYKHIDQNYIQAPKLGYRISFDVKTSGTYKKNINANSSTRSIRITPSYYYISKDGKIFDNNIDLYYKNSSGKYVNFAGSGYSIYFKPNDGYRTTYNPEAAELKDMSTKMEALKIGGQTKNGTVDASFELTDNMMSYSDNNFVQAWYGEFKLPNSTIAVKKGENIKNQLTDGYIGVIFKIECIDKESKNATEETIVSYSNEDKSYAGTPVNTTQWDYEGYLGFSKQNIGINLNGELRIQLEKDYWVINTQELYSKVKGTVVLFDIDNRAANDFE